MCQIRRWLGFAGGFSLEYAGEGDEDSYSEQLASTKELDMGITAALVPALKSTDTARIGRSSVRPPSKRG
ncbi:MAG: hypothetical protein WCK39_07240 [Methanomassiliicoccales archaeon]